MRQKTLFPFSIAVFYEELENSLPSSTEAQRTEWAKTIIANDLDLIALSRLLSFEPKVATRFLWLLSNVGMQHAEKLFGALPFLFEEFEKNHPEYLYAFATYWRLVGVPPENEGRAVELLFQWLLSPEINTSIKSRVIFVLVEFTKKYPEIRGEFRMCLIDQMDNYSKDFKKRIQKILENWTSDNSNLQ